MGIARVTEILSPFSDFRHVKPQILEKATVRGNTVHAICAGIAKDNWIPDGMVDSRIIGYINSFRKWASSQVKKFVIVEKRFAENELLYTGQVDFVILGNDNELYLIDIKTSANPQKTYPVQMAAYNHLLRKNNIQVKGAMLVYLSSDGEFPEVHLLENMSEEFDVFMGALTCWNYFNKGRKDVREDSTTIGACITNASDSPDNAA